MAMTRYASFEVSEVLDVKGAATQQKTASLDKLSDFNDFRTEDGYMYARIRAISSRVNKNNDGWPSIELAGNPDIFDQHTSSEGFTVEAKKGEKYGFSTFLGKPIFVDHNNTDPSRARGVIVDAKFHVEDQKTSALDPYYSSDDVDPEHLPAAWVELLLEVDADRFPVLANAIKEGDIDGFSMGCDVDKTICNICSNEATAPSEFCEHIRMKGATFDYREASGERKSRKSYENCYGVKFFEISAVFDPADETALLRELIHKEGSEKLAAVTLVRCPTCGQNAQYSTEAGYGTCPNGHTFDSSQAPQGQFGPLQAATGPFVDPNPEQVIQHARRIAVDNPGMTVAEAIPFAEAELRQRFNIDPSQVHGEGEVPDHVKVKDTMPMPSEMSVATPRRQGSPLQARVAAIKAAANPAPQSELTKAPEDVDTLRKEQVCPICGSDSMENGKCDVCGHEEPPEGLNTPDLTQAENFNEESELGVDKGIEQRAESPLQARKDQLTASVTGEMRWTNPKISPKAAGRVNPQERPIQPDQGPATDEPRETVIKDEPTPVTSSTRNAADLIAAAGQPQQENSMSDETRTAAEPADPSGKPDQRVDVEGTGAVTPGANAESQSKPDRRVDVEGKGGVMDASNAEATEAEHQNVETEGEKQTSGPTKTWSEDNGTKAVTDKAFPNAQSFASTEAAAKGVKPLGGEDVQPQRREDLEEVNEVKPQSGTDQWTGTDGNGVTRQQDPVTKKVDPNIEQPRKSSITSHIVNVMKLADTEIDLGITAKEAKYQRIAELEQEDEVTIEARLDTLSRVKTAGLARQASVTLHRLPSLAREAAVEPQEKTANKLDDPRYDQAIFGVA